MRMFKAEEYIPSAMFGAIASCGPLVGLRFKTSLFSNFVVAERGI